MWSRIVVDEDQFNEIVKEMDGKPVPANVAVFHSTSYPIFIEFSPNSFDKLKEYLPVLQKYKPEQIPTPNYLGKKDDPFYKFFYGHHNYSF